MRIFFCFWEHPHIMSTCYNLQSKFGWWFHLFFPWNMKTLGDFPPTTIIRCKCDMLWFVFFLILSCNQGCDNWLTIQPPSLAIIFNIVYMPASTYSVLTYCTSYWPIDQPTDLICKTQTNYIDINQLHYNIPTDYIHINKIWTNWQPMNWVLMNKNVSYTGNQWASINNQDSQSVDRKMIFKEHFHKIIFSCLWVFLESMGQVAIRGWSDNHLEMNMATRIAPVLERTGRSYLQIIRL
jgi:hypothetical protein